MTLVMTGCSHQDGDVSWWLFGATAVAATRIKPSGTASVMSTLEHNPEQTGRHGGNYKSTTGSLRG